MSDGIVVRVNGVEGLDRVLQQISPTCRQAGAIAINRTVEEALIDQRAKIQQRFTVRVPRFVLPPDLLPRAWRATPDRLWAVAALGDSQMINQSDIGSRRRRIMEPHGAAQTRTTRDPTNYPIAIPTRSLRPSSRDLVPRRMYPRQLVGQFAGGTHQASRTVGHAGQFLGLGSKARNRVTIKKSGDVFRRQVGRYFVVGGPGSRVWGLFERTGKGNKGNAIRMLWHFEAATPIHKRLDWEREVKGVIGSRFEPNYDGAIQQAMARAVGLPR